MLLLFAVDQQLARLAQAQAGALGSSVQPGAAHVHCPYRVMYFVLTASVARARAPRFVDSHMYVTLLSLSSHDWCL